MLSKIYLILASLLLSTPASSLPKNLATRDKLDVECGVETVTISTTIFVADGVRTTSPDPGQASAGVAQQSSPVAGSVTAAAVESVLNDSTEVPQATVPTPSKDEPCNDNYPETVASPVVVHAPGTSELSGSSQTTDVVPGNLTGEVPASGTYKNVLYFTNWGIYGANYQPQQLPAAQITHVLYAFADIAADGQVISSDSYADLQKHYPTDSWNEQGNNVYGCVKQLFLLKKNNRQMKVLLSIGGWTYSPKFAPIAGTDAGRQKFATSALTLVKDWGFDGIDIDWEYPSNAAEAQNFVQLLQACRQAFDDYARQYAPGYHFIITVASPAGSNNYNGMDLAGMDPWVDLWNLMAYDYAGSWDSTSGHQANIYVNDNIPSSTKFSTEQAVHDYIARGIPSKKIMMGLPLYGRSFEATSGLGQPYNGVGAGSSQSGVWLYKDLPRPGAREIYDDVAKASYSYDSSTEELISYDTVSSAVTKAQYLMGKGLGGAVFWEASGDRAGGDSLVGTLAQQLSSLDSTPNLLSYPASQYDNIRAGMPGV